MKATSSSWKTEPLPTNRIRLKLERSFDKAEWEALQLGSIPEEMEDKWFIYEEGGWLNFHRSWTGICIFRVGLRKTPTGMEIAEAWVNRDKEQYTCVDDDYDARLLSWLIDVLLLKRPAQYPGSGLRAVLEPLRQWSEVGRAMLTHDNDGSVAAMLDGALRDAPDLPAKNPKKRQRMNTEPCAECGSLDVVPILYGYPGPGMMDAAEQGRIALGGCCVGERDPQKQCNACGSQFDPIPPRVTGRARREK